MVGYIVDPERIRLGRTRRGHHPHLRALQHEVIVVGKVDRPGAIVVQMLLQVGARGHLRDVLDILREEDPGTQTGIEGQVIEGLIGHKGDRRRLHVVGGLLLRDHAHDLLLCRVHLPPYLIAGEKAVIGIQIALELGVHLCGGHAASSS